MRPAGHAGRARTRPDRYSRGVRWLPVACLLLVTAACASPSTDFSRRVVTLGLAEGRVRGEPFEHLLVRNPKPAGARLHVYLEGDGTPWLGGLPARDPTPRRPLALALMAQDPAASVYLGRPCYHGVGEGPSCPDTLWTSARYSETVLTSMAAVIRRIVAAEGVQELVWFGYSGGGTLAVLLASRVPQSVAVITLAANLDTDAWADLHGDRPLVGSLNPARQPPLPDQIVQIHYAGGRDRLVPVEIVRGGVTGGGRLVVEPEFDHVCCWAASWPRILGEVERATRSGRPDPAR